jgi:S1-C subfamily serine protease
VTYVVVAALAAGVGAGAVLAVNHQSTPNSAAGQRRQQSRSGLAGGTGLSSTAEQAIVNKVEPGLVDITSSLQYSGGTAEATGMVISPSGLVLTNNHVIDGSTRLTATLVGSGRRYQATVVGYDMTNDVAVIRLTGASGLRTVPIGNSSSVRLNNPVVALGNADGQGVTRPVTGSITGTNQTITASDEGSQTGKEILHGMLQTNAQIVPGDSGGALADVHGKVIGMNTAAATGTFGAGGSVGFAIPANKALAIARQIEAGQSGRTVRIGLSGFMGVLVPGQKAALSASPARQQQLQVKSDNNIPSSGLGGSQGCLPNDINMPIPSKIAPVQSGTLIDGVLCGTPADTAGISGGDVITSVGGHAVASPHSLTNLMVQYRPGAQVTVIWVDPAGHRHTSGMTLTKAPPT